MKDGIDRDLYVKRFSIYRIIEHWLVAVLFAILVTTGLSQKFYESGFSQWFVISLGGIDVVRIVHRAAGAVFGCLLLQHIIVASCGVILKKWQPSILIGKKDFTDLIDNLKYYFGVTNVPARCDRYDYKQKFEYWGIFAGGLIMITTGLTLWFPTTAARYLPGSVIPAAKALHSNVAMMIFLITALWHVYNSIFSPDVFPIDMVMFTGRISTDRMMREHPLEFERFYGCSLEDGELGAVKDKIREERRQETGG
jgi:formate dehydrogenase subunit gamma